jgi:hypothetical protein
MKKFLPLATIGLIIFSCGGGSSSTVSKPKIEGTVETSYVEGLKVCLENTDECTYTDRNGHFELNGKIPAKVVFYLKTQNGEIAWADYSLKRNGEFIYPLKVADNNKTIAKVLGAILHALDNDTSGNKDYISLKGKLITSIEDENGNRLNINNLKEFLKNNENRFTVKFENENTGKEDEIKIDPQSGEVSLCFNGSCKEVNYNPVKYDWVVVILYAGDNNLSDFVDLDIQELQKVRIPSNIKIVGLADYLSPEGGYIYETNDTTGKYELTSTTSEPNMGDPDYIYNFLSKVYDEFPSKYRALIMWDHGLAWRVPTSKQNKLMAEDDGDKDYLYSYEFVEVLDKLKKDGIKLNLIGFDECLMGNTEVFWDISDYTDWMVGSELFEPGTGWDYTRLFSKVAQNPQLTPEEFAKDIVDAYAEAYSNRSDITMLAASSGDVKNLVDNLNRLADEFNPQNDEVVNLFQNARENAYEIEASTDTNSKQNHQLIDLYSFAVQLQNTYPEAKNIVNLINGMYKKIVGNDKVKGLSIFFPPSREFDDADYYCTPYTVQCGGYYNPFTETHWDEFLQKYLNTVSNQ